MKKIAILMLKPVLGSIAVLLVSIPGKVIVVAKGLIENKRTIISIAGQVGDTPWNDKVKSSKKG